MGSPKGKLSALQTETLEALVRRAPDFFLTGGAVLVGWTLKHRITDDLARPLHTTSDDAMAGADAAVRGAATDVHATVTPV
jgi:hypothetical protein